MQLVELAVKQPKTVTVGVILALFAGLLAFSRVPIQMSPTVESVVISVTTTWENASPQEIETDVIDEQEQRLGEVSGLVSMTSISQAGRSQIRLEFRAGTDINAALAEVDQKLSEVPSYPAGVNEPEIEPLDPDSVDYIAWIGLASTDPDFDATTLYDFMDRRLKPRFERIPGVSQVGILGAREKELQVRVDPLALAQRGITYRELVQALQFSNENFSAGRLPDGKNDIRVRAVGRFTDAATVGNLVIRRDAAGPIYLRDIADVTVTHKEMTDWVRARGQLMPFFNFQLAYGANLLETVGHIQAEVARLNEPGGLLAQHARKRGLNGTLELVQTYDASTYVEQAIDLVQTNLVVGGVLATLTLLLFLRSLRSIGIIAVAIPISVIASMVILLALGRTINIISLAGMAFAVGMVVDNAIVVIENIFRHLESGKPVAQAAVDGAREVGGAVLAATLTTMIVFVPILAIEEQAGQLFRDIALAIMAAVGLSLVVSLTVIPSASAHYLSARRITQGGGKSGADDGRLAALAARVRRAPEAIANGVYGLMGRKRLRLAVIAGFALATLAGIAVLIPPLDYLPRGNRNIVFSIMFPPPGYNLDQLSAIGERLETKVRPVWEATEDKFEVEAVRRGDQPSAADQQRPGVNMAAGAEDTVRAPALDHYFLVAWEGRVFQVGITAEPGVVVDAIPFFDQALAGSTAPDVLSFSFQFPLFRTGGTTGSAVKIDLSGSDLSRVTASGGALLQGLVERFGPDSLTPEPANFLLPTPELRIVPNDERLRELGMTRTDVGLAVQANGDGLLLVREFEIDGELKDLKIISPQALGETPIRALLNAPLATSDSEVVDLGSVARIERIRMPDQIKHVDRQRAVTLQLTPPAGMPLESAIGEVNALVEKLRSEGTMPPDVEVSLSGSAGKLNDIKTALLGDGSLIGTVTSSMFLALIVVYLLMVVLFQSWSYPVVIMVSVPLATLGGFLGLALIHAWTVADHYAPIQNMDVLTLLGFVILAGVVVNNAILIVHQSRNFLREAAGRGEAVDPHAAIAEAVRTRVRPILMSSLTSVGGMLPLVLMLGSGSELYRGLGAVVVGGLAVSTVFTLVLVPLVLSLVFEHKGQSRRGEQAQLAQAEARKL